MDRTDQDDVDAAIHNDHADYARQRPGVLELMKQRERAVENARLDATYRDIPERMWDGIANYMVRCEPVGDFLTALFENDLAEAGIRGDPEDVKAWLAYSLLLWNVIPRPAWGSPISVTNWLDLADELAEAVRAAESDAPAAEG